MNQELHEIIDTTYTKDNLHRKVVLLEEFFGSYFFKESEGRGSIKEEFKDFLIDEHVGEYLRNSLLNLNDAFFNLFQADTFRAHLESIKEEMNTKPTLTLYVATLLPPVEVEKLGIWARENISPGVYLDLEVDTKVIGGCAFVWNGVYHDYSLRYYVDKHSSEIRGLLRDT